MSRTIPFIRQVSPAECGAACLAMVLRYFGRVVPLQNIRELAVSGRDGSTAAGLVSAAGVYGLSGTTVAIDLAQVSMLDRPAILHWDFQHFVVLDKVNGDRVRILDPAHGPRTVSFDELGRHFTGVAILLRPGASFIRGRAPRSRSVLRLTLLSGAIARLGIPILGTTVAIQALGVTVPLMARVIVNRLIYDNSPGPLQIVTGAALAAILCQTWISIIRSNLIIALKTQIDASVSDVFMAQLLRLPLEFFQQRSTGDLLARFDSNAMIREILTTGAVSSVLDGLSAAGFFGVLLYANAQIAAVAAGFAAVHILLCLFVRSHHGHLRADTIDIRAKSHNYQSDILRAIESVKTGGAEERVLARWRALFQLELYCTGRRAKLDAVMDAATGLIRSAMAVAIIAVGAREVLSHYLTLGDMVLLAVLASVFIESVITATSAATGLQHLRVYLDRFLDVMNTPPERSGHTVRCRRLNVTPTIDLYDVSFRYSRLSALALRNISMSIGAGEVIAIVGRSGSGKSTLARVIVGLYAATAGRIEYDGIDSVDMDVGEFRKQVGIVTQQVQLFGTSIRDNIALANPSCTIQEIISAAKMACIHDDVAALPLSYDTPLMDRGALLSGGQQQRIALARTLITKPRLLVLDEATNQLDTVTEAAVFESLSQLNCTRVVISHRLSTIADANRIYVMEDGEIVEFGSHRDLLSRQGSYARLLSAQTRSADVRS